MSEGMVFQQGGRDGRSLARIGRPGHDRASEVDLACDRFEAGWRAGERPRVEDVLGDFAESDRPLLVRELIRLEVELSRVPRAVPG